MVDTVSTNASKPYSNPPKRRGCIRRKRLSCVFPRSGQAKPAVPSRFPGAFARDDGNLFRTPQQLGNAWNVCVFRFGSKRHAKPPWIFIILTKPIGGDERQQALICICKYFAVALLRRKNDMVTGQIRLHMKIIASIPGQTHGAAMSHKLILQDFLPYLLNRAGLRVGVIFSRDIEAYVTSADVACVCSSCGSMAIIGSANCPSAPASIFRHCLVWSLPCSASDLIVRRRSGLDGRALSMTLTQKRSWRACQIVALCVAL